MEGSESKRRKVVNKKNDLLTKLQKKIKKKVKKKIKRNEKRDEGLNRNRHCRKIGVPELGRLRKKGAPGREGMFLKGLRTQYISRETLNEANEARKNEDINKIIDIGRVFQNKKGDESGTWRGEVENAAQSAVDTEETMILQENNFDQQQGQDARTKKKTLNLDKELVMFSLLYEEKIGSQLLPRLTDNDILEEAFRALRNKPEKNKSKKDEAIENEFVKEFNFLRENSKPELPVAEIFREDFRHRNHARGPGNRSSDIFMGILEKPMEVHLINLRDGTGTCDNDPILLFGREQERSTEQTKEYEKSTLDLNIATPQIQFYRRNMF